MSTPQDNPYSGQNDRNGHPWNTPDPTGGTSSPTGQNQSGQYNHPGAQSPGYSYPGGGSFPQQAEKGPAPKEVMRAYYLILAAGILYLISAVGSALLTDLSAIPGASSTAVNVGYAFGFVIAAVVTAIYVVLAVFIRKGHNWARIVATVLAGLNLVATLFSLLVTPLIATQAAEMGQPLPDTPALSVAISVIVLLLGLSGVVMTYLKPARPYFAPRPIGY
jgi:hypothetical protein